MARGTWSLTKPRQTANTRKISTGDRAPGANVRTQKGNNPDRRLRSRILAKWKTKCKGPDNQEVGLEAAIL